MKKQLLLLSSALLTWASIQAQCTITPSCTPDVSTGFCTTPTGGSSLPDATIMVPYSTVIQASVGTTAGGGAIPIDAVTVTGATLPAGLSYSLNPSAGIVGGGNGCILISGTPTAWSASALNVIFNVVAMSGGSSIPTTLEFTMMVNDNTSSVTSMEKTGLSFFPNPTSDQLTITVSEPTTIKIVNVLGTEVLVKRISSTSTISVADFKEGVYFISSENTGRSAKFIKK